MDTETDTNAAINLILDSFSVKHPPRQESSWSQDPTSLELPSLISVPEEDGPSLIAPCGRRSSSSSYGSTSQCGSQYGYKTTKRDVAVQTESHPKQRGDPKSPGEGTSTSDMPTTSPEPQGATASPQLTPTANTSRGKSE
ncbi:uncharacterized protein [Argopecten irradians]|uniref:uncharacterized protein isoform X2 n=1 Tax=Argopecten irradians TaxID=31199 RepID=UPI0037142CF9